jgi:hypothetical protein
MSAAPNNPGLVSSHAQYVKGAAEVREEGSFGEYFSVILDTDLIPGDYRKRYRQ